MTHKMIGTLTLLAMLAFTFGVALYASGVMDDFKKKEVARKNAAIIATIKKDAAK